MSQTVSIRHADFYKFVFNLYLFLLATQTTHSTTHDICNLLEESVPNKPCASQSPSVAASVPAHSVTDDPSYDDIDSGSSVSQIGEYSSYEFSEEE